MVNIRINNKELSVAKDLTILQAASLADIQIPRFCYHEKLTIAGNCRMCLVEVAKVNKPVASCALPVHEGMQVFTNTILVKKAREGVLELLLANHPLDCPICDQGGECDLQEQAMIFGNDRSRFYESKRAVSDKTISPFIKTIMTRCIHCTRCVRFLNEVSGVNELGITGRGSASEIGTYVKNSISSELSGNVIDLCPVGALTSKPYAFTARPWELRSTETIDLMDSLGTNIKVDTRGPNIMRILPKINEEVNEEWITDKTRFSFDGFKSQRLNTPMYSQNIILKYKIKNCTCTEASKVFLNCSWEIAFLIFKEFFTLYKTQSSLMNIILGNQLSIETMTFINELKNRLGFENVMDQQFFDGYNFNLKKNSIKKSVDLQSSYLMNISPLELEKVEICLLVGANIRLENPLLNSRLRKAFLQNNAQIASIGPSMDKLYNLKKLGNCLSSFIKILEGKHSFNFNLINSKKALILFGNSIAMSDKLKHYLDNIKIKNRNISTFTLGSLNNNIGENIISEYNSISSLTCSNNININNSSFNFFVQADDINFNINLASRNFQVYQGFQADRCAQNSDLIFPQSNYLEEVSSFFDINSKTSHTNVCLPAPVGSRTSWKILSALSEYFISKNNIKNNRRIIMNLNKINKRLDPKFNIKFPIDSNKIIVSNTIFNNNISNFYKTNSITRNSKVMSQITKQNKNIRY